MTQLADVILYYHRPSFFLDPDWSPVPTGRRCRYTGDKARFFEAKAVLFDIPTLTSEETEHLAKIRLAKPEGQIWVAFSQESDQCFPLLNDPGFMALFDLEMSYRQTAQVWTPYVNQEVAARISSAPVLPKRHLCAAFISSRVNLSRRLELLEGLMQHLPIHSFGSQLQNSILEEDQGNPQYSQARYQTKLRTLRRYRYTIAFENSLSDDYVTEKFFHPLMAGSIPVYLGASNVADYAPGKDAFINAANFPHPRELAEFLLEAEDAKYQEWRSRPLEQSFLDLVSRTTQEPFDELCDLVFGRK